MISSWIIHYEGMTIQIYWKFYHQKQKSNGKKYDNFLISSPSMGSLMEPPRRGCFIEYPRPVYLGSNGDINVYPCEPQFYDTRVGFEKFKIGMFS